MSKTNIESKSKKLIDVVVPCYNEAENISAFYDAMTDVESGLESYEFNYIFADDGSSDETLMRIKELRETRAAEPGRIRYISFSRNFGKESAIYAGLNMSADGYKGRTADYTLLIDADLQHPPREIPHMISIVEEPGCDSCAARRATRRGEPVLRSAFSSLFYKIMNRFSDIQITEGAMDFRIMSARMVRALVDLPETQRFSKGLFTWVGFETKWIDIQIDKRQSGTSKWSPLKLLNYAVAGFLDFAGTPLKLAGIMGVLISLLSGVYLIAELIKTIFFGKDLPGYASIICLLLLFGGALVALIALIGEYISRMYIETKRRPVYVTREQSDDDGEE